MRIYDAAVAAPWAALPEAVEQLLVIAAREHDPQALEAYRAARADRGERLLIRDNVAILGINGMMFKRANMLVQISGATSYEILRRDLQAALDDPKVDAIMLNIDSPGGELSACDELATAIYAARARKPITAYVSGVGASAAYWLASACHRIVVSDAAVVGSIGVVLGITDRTKADELSGISRVEFVSSQSPGKRPDHGTDEGKARIQKLVDDMGDVFVTAVAKYRGVSKATVLSKFGQGGSEVGANAVVAGMVDEVGQFEATLKALSARGKSGRSLKPGAPLPAPAPRNIAAASGPHAPLLAAEPTTADGVALVLSASRMAEYRAAGLGDADIAAINNSIVAERQRFAAFLAIDERRALPALHAHLMDATETTPDEATKILKAAKADLQALAVVVAIDPADAYFAQKIRDGALGTEGWSVSAEGKVTYDASSARDGGWQSIIGAMNAKHSG